MRLLANGAEVTFLTESAGPPTHRYWLYSVWVSGAVTVDGVVCRAKNIALNWQLAIDVQIDGNWTAHKRSGSLQDTFESILRVMEEVGVPKGLSWVEDNVGPCADPYDMKIEAAPVEWRILKP